MTSPQLDLTSTGARALVGYDIETDPQGDVLVSLSIGGQHLNRVDTLHGGIVSMLLDTAMGVAASRHFQTGDSLPQVVTLSLTTDFLSAAPSGQRVVARGWIDGGGHKICYAKAELRGEAEEGRLYASGSSVLKRVRDRE
ncbi:putative domain 1 [Thalassovita autumnalis]|uniref:Domain 1 n=1 Tax=Thalassovita autumnalis TaxID=2072972 RepID=A0A0P1FL40_9RHOB|nr:putative domain 1 [Thalassovita autumnalis]CUH71351.1 putative domain 1 [Thalassovita autumnalis]